MADLSLLPRPMPVAAVALASLRTAIRRPLAPLLVVLFGLSIALSPFYTLFAFGAEAKLVRDAGLASIRFLSLLIAVAFGSGILLGEIDRRSIGPVLAAPVRRVEVLLGRFAGGALTIALSTSALAATLVATVLASEGRLALELLGPAYLALLEGLVLAGLSTALSAVLPLTGNVIATFSLFVVGNLGPWLERYASIDAPSVLVPAFARFDVQGALPPGRSVAPDYLAWATASAALYLVFWLALGAELFRRREVS